MPIITVQRRMAEQGRIRLGHKISGTTQQGKSYTRPAKLEKFRFTSPSERLINEIAAHYGGEPRPWDNAGKAEFEVLSDATAIPVIVVKGGFSQWHEHFTKAGLQHRCDGEKDAAGNYCDPDDQFHIEAIQKPTTRLSVMLSEIESLGVWRMESKGWNAAAELPSMAELAMHVGDLVPATLGLAERSSIIQTDKGPQTSRYVVPFLDLHVTKQRLVEIVGGVGGTPALEGAGSAPAALEAPRSDPYAEWLPQVDAAEDIDSLTVIWNEMRDGHELVGQDSTPSAQREAFVEYFRRRAAAIKAASSPEAGTGEAATSTPAASPPPGAAGPQPDADGAYPAETVGPDADQVWADIVKAGGERGMTLPDIEQDVAGFLNGGDVDGPSKVSEASGEELQAYLNILVERAA